MPDSFDEHFPQHRRRSSRASVAEQVFGTLHHRILTLEMPPGMRLSEAEVARDLGVSRQPVRDAFSRLARLGLLTIRPQIGTEVSRISEPAIRRAQFVRTALEVETIKIAALSFGAEDIAALADLIAEQEAAKAAGDAPGFQALDDAFHAEIFCRAGVGFVWETIVLHKAHKDRVRYLGQKIASARTIEDHGRILAALEARDPAAAEAAMRLHLSRILSLVVDVRRLHGDAFETGEAGEPAAQTR